MGVARALSLGLQADHPVLQRAAGYIQAVLAGRVEFPDTHEKNDRWETGMRLFLAATLAQILPDDPFVAHERRLWAEIAKQAFQSGSYREADEIAAHAALTGASSKGSYLVLNGRYQLELLGSAPGLFGEELENALLGWVWEHPGGIGYLSIPLSQPTPHPPGPLDRWFNSLELLARCFPGWVVFAAGALDWIWEQRRPDGTWDFGPRAPESWVLPFSDDWRRRPNRTIDWTSRVLALLRSG
jgi:hypothetical protein